MDRRLFPATDRVAHISLRGQITDRPLTAGENLTISQGLVDLLQSPHGARERQLPFGAEFCVIDRDGDDAFGMADGYCGWVAGAALHRAPPPTHWVSSTGTHLYSAPRVQSPVVMELPMGAKVSVIGQDRAFLQTPQGFVPGPHLTPIGTWLTDPAALAIGFLGAPYLWGGNSRAGLDCSGLVQMCLRACGIAAPADSDLQEVLGVEATGDLRRNDLVFWPGHVAMVVDSETLIHANGFTMSVAYEGIAPCIARIGPTTHRRRIT